LGKLGKQLVDSHLLKSAELDTPVFRFQGAGASRVEKQRDDETEQRVYINVNQYFEGIEKVVWDYRIGGYQVLDKGLKDRKKRVRSLEEIRHDCRIATALKKTIAIQKRIDAMYGRAEENIFEAQPLKLLLEWLSSKVFLAGAITHSRSTSLQQFIKRNRTSLYLRVRCPSKEDKLISDTSS